MEPAGSTGGGNPERAPLLVRPYHRGPLPWDAARCRKAGAFVLAALTLERLAYYAVVSTLYLYLNKGECGQSWSSEQALAAVLATSGVAYASSPIGGWLADACTGRFMAIMIGYGVYLLGMGLLAALSHRSLAWLGCQPNDYTTAQCQAVVYGTLCMIGMGVGTIKANLAPFGAEQVKHGGPSLTRAFFNAYYWCVNVGSLVGVAVVGYVAQNTQPNGFFYGYVSAGSCLALSMIAFALGRPCYLAHRPSGSVLTDVVRILWEGRPRCRRREARHPPSRCLDRAKIRFGGSHHDGAVEDVRQLGRVMSVLLSLVPFWLVYFQMQSGFQAQALHLKVTLPEASAASGLPQFTIPAAWMTLCDQLSVLVLVPIVTSVLYPCLERRGYRVPLLVRMLIGMCFSLLAACWSGALESANLHAWATGDRHTQNVSDTVYNCTSVSVLWQLPQYAFVGCAEVFAGIASLEFSYAAAPRSLQGVVMGLHWLLEGGGSFLGTCLVQMLSGVWIKGGSGEYFQGRMDLYFFLLAGLQGACLVAFGGWLAWRWVGLTGVPGWRGRAEEATTEEERGEESTDEEDEAEPQEAGAGFGGHEHKK